MDLKNDLLYPPGPEVIMELESGEDALEHLSALFLQYGPVYKVFSDQRKAFTYVITDPEMIRHVMITNNRNYTKGVGIDRVKLLLGNGIMGSEGEFWKRQRRMIQPAFHRKVIARLSHEIITANNEMLQRWEGFAKEGLKINLTDELSQVTLRIVLQALFSEDIRDQDSAAARSSFSILTEEHARDLSFAIRFRSLSSIIFRFIQQRRKEKREEEDFLSMLMAAFDHETGIGMTDKEIIDEVMTLIVAGHETTATALNWVWYFLSAHLEVYGKLKAEVHALPEMPGFDQLPYLSYTRQVIEEALRLYPPGWLLTRRAVRDDQIGPYYVPAHTDIFISPYLVHRRADIWDAPDQFNPDRFDPRELQQRPRFEYFPFGGGPRQCIGDYFAMVEMQLHLAMVIRRFDVCVIPPGQIKLEAQINLRPTAPFYAYLNFTA